MKYPWKCSTPFSAISTQNKKEKKRKEKISDYNKLTLEESCDFTPRILNLFTSVYTPALSARPSLIFMRSLIKMLLGKTDNSHSTWRPDQIPCIWSLKRILWNFEFVLAQLPNPLPPQQPPRLEFSQVLSTILLCPSQTVSVFSLHSSYLLQPTPTHLTLMKTLLVIIYTMILGLILFILFTLAIYEYF